MTETPPPPAQRVAILLQHLQRAVAACSAGGALPAPLIVWIWNRLARMAQRFARLAARIEAGTFKPRRPYRRKPPADRKPRPPSLTPQRFGWLMPLVPWVPMRQFWSGTAHSNLRHLLTEPDMQALMAEAPAEMGRILRPLCWMLGIKPPPVLTRRRPAAAAQPAQAATAAEPPPARSNRVQPGPPDPPSPPPPVQAALPARPKPQKA